MKHIAFLVLFSLTTLLSSSCSDDENTSDLSSINGQWKWVKSTGGFGGAETPASTGKIINLQITDAKVKLYENGNLISDKSYTIKVIPSVLGDGGDKKMWVFEDDWKQSYELSGNMLKLSDECNDCYILTYVKERN